MATLNINGQNKSVDAASDTPLLWAIREQLQMTGTKFGCGAGLCGACTVHVNGEAVRSCQTAISEVAGKKITTIEGLSAKGDHPLQKAWVAEQVPQCGYCQSGQIMQAASLLSKNSNPDQGRNRRAHGRQSLPLHDLFADPQGDHARRLRNAHGVQSPATSGGPHEQARENRPTSTPPISAAARSWSAPPPPASRSVIPACPALGGDRR